MLIGARMAAWSGEKLPYLRGVKCIKSNGYQYIRTGIIPNPLQRYDISFVAHGNGYLFGVHDTDYDVGLAQGPSDYNYFVGFFAAGIKQLTLDAKHHITLSRSGYNLDDGARIISVSQLDKTTSLDMYVFGWHYSTYMYGCGVLDLYGFSIEDDNIPSNCVNMVPCVNDFGGGEEGCFYDTVGKRFFRGYLSNHTFGWEEEDGTIVQPT